MCRQSVSNNGPAVKNRGRSRCFRSQWRRPGRPEVWGLAGFGTIWQASSCLICTEAHKILDTFSEQNLANAVCNLQACTAAVGHQK